MVNDFVFSAEINNNVSVVKNTVRTLERNLNIRIFFAEIVILLFMQSLFQIVGKYRDFYIFRHRFQKNERFQTDVIVYHKNRLCRL